MLTVVRAPFPYMGGKHAVAGRVWAALGDVDSYVEPFAGSLAVLLARPAEHVHSREIVNDADGLIVNVWRALAWQPDETARWAHWPATESDLHARHAWLVGARESLTDRLEGDPRWCDPQAAGWWLWGAASWIAGGWCVGRGPWSVVDGRLVRDGTPQGTKRQIPQLGAPRGVQKRRASDSPWGDGTHLQAWFAALAARLAHVTICAGDFARVLTPTPLFHGTGAAGVAGVFLDPPYDPALRATNIYAVDCADGSVSARAREWCATAGTDPRVRIVIAGYGAEHDQLLDHGWTKEHWSGSGGYARNPAGGLARRHEEALWFSPECLDGEHVQMTFGT